MIPSATERDALFQGFARAFRRETGQTPTAWREAPASIASPGIAGSAVGVLIMLTVSLFSPRGVRRLRGSVAHRARRRRGGDTSARHLIPRVTFRSAAVVRLAAARGGRHARSRGRGVASAGRH